MHPSKVANVDQKSEFPFPLVQLHAHLDGCARIETLWEYVEACVKAGAKMPVNVETFDDYKKALIVTEPAELGVILKRFSLILPYIAGNAEAIERIAYEMCEDQARDGVVYFEARYAVNFLIKDQKLDADGVINAITRGLKRGEEKFGIKSRQLLCCLCDHAEWNKHIVEIALRHRHNGVVGIDAAGCASGADEKYEPSVVTAYLDARKAGLHRTIHAGETGAIVPGVDNSTQVSVRRAIEEMHCERIGHGYRMNLDKELYKKHALDSKDVHFEACPLSAMMTGAFGFEDWKTHPIVRWAADGVNFSISTDDTSLLGNSMKSELVLVRDKIGLTLEQIWQCQLNAAKASFLPEDEKKKLVETIEKAKPSKE